MYRNLLQPRLGKLNQHAPVPMCVQEKYARTSDLSQLPKISIVTPSFNQGEFIERTILSVLDQAYPRLEYIVQDGASEDGTKEVLSHYPDRLLQWESISDSGQSQALNYGFEKTTGEIMSWINSDDLLLPGTLDYVADFFNSNPEVDVIYGNRILIDESDQQIGRWILPQHDNDVMAWQDYIPQETLFWRRDIWDRAGAYIDESFQFAMDWDLLVRFKEAGARFSRLPRFMGGFRVHSQQKTSAAIDEIGLKEMDRVRVRALGYAPSRNSIRLHTWPYLIRHIATDWWWFIHSGLMR